MPNANPPRVLRNLFPSQIALVAPTLIFCLVFLTPAAASHEEHGNTFKAPGATIYYEVFGSGSGTPFFLANGGPGFDHNYLHVSDAWDTLGQNRKIVMWDQRGTGRSEPLKPGQSCTLADQINDLDALRAHLGFEKIDLLGHSWGGFLAMAYAARFPQHIERLIVLDSTDPRFRDTVFLFGDVFPEIPAREYSSDSRDPVAARETADGVYLSMLFYSPEHRDEFLGKTANEKRNFQVSDSVFEDLLRVDLSPELAKFRFPVLVGTGRFDVNIAPVTAYKIHQAIPRSEFVAFEKSGHMPFFEEPGKFVMVLNKFLAQVMTKSAPH